ncbi:MAG: COR domain-containing protein [Cyanobacteria bacterium J06621_3]
MSSSRYAKAQQQIEEALKNSVTFLDLSRLGLTEVPPEVCQLQGLTQLKLYGNQLTVLPLEVFQLQNLTELNLNRNQLTALPPEVFQLQNLTKLDLSQNPLTALPPEVFQLQNLVELSLYGNQLTALPPEVFQLQNLEELSLYGNQLTTLPPEVGQLQNLTGLSLSYNQLTTLPPEVGQLQNLTQLDLSSNQLTALPPEVGQLQNLTQLNLSSNQLTALPPEVGQLQNLTRLNLYNNPYLESPSPEVCDQGLQAILIFLREQQTANERQWISKLLVVGEGGVGKTSLLRALKGEPFQVQQSTTHGVEITTLPLSHPIETDVTMTLNAWDFGGQEIYHATHQFFLTNRSLFLLAFNARIGFEQGKLVYWLKTIRANAPDSPIILVATYADERDADLPFTDLQKQFPKIVALYEVSNKTGKGIPVLKQALTHSTANLPLMGERWPTTWLNFANSIRTGTEKQTTPQTFFANMEKAGVSQDGKPILARWLHELGDILFFQNDDDVNDLVILKPQWVTEYISKVLEAEEVIQRRGLFTRQCMDQVWQDLTVGLRDFFLRLMERFDLSYRTLEKPDISLVVERLPFEEPDYQKPWDAKKQKANCKEISMKFQLSEILPGIPTWFIARQHRFTIEQGERRGIHWRTGVLFQDRSQKHLALIRTLRDETTNADHLHLTVRGPIPHNFFDILRDGLELTLSRYPGLKITRLLPCPDPTDIDCHHEFDYANLSKRLERTPPKDIIECPNCLEDISVTRLLFGIHYTTQTAVIAKIDTLQDSFQDTLIEGFDTQRQHLQELSAIVQRDVLQEIRAVQKQIESPCPTLFAIRPDGRSPYDVRNITSQQFRLQLYCEHPGCLHPVQQGGLYTVDNPQQWLSTVGPHLKRITGILKYVTPIIGPWVTLADADYAKLIKDDLTLTNDLVKTLPSISYTHDDRDFIDSTPNRQTQRVSGSALRALHEFLKEKDKQKTWGHLSRIKTPEGDILWLCEHHKREFYPTSG